MRANDSRTLLRCAIKKDMAALLDLQLDDVVDGFACLREEGLITTEIGDDDVASKTFIRVARKTAKGINAAT